MADEYEEGEDYEELLTTQPTSAENKIEVLELFWYGCPHCYKLEPYVENWKKKLSSDVKFVQYPAILRNEWAIHARAFFTAQILGVDDKTHQAIFAAFHELRRPANSEKALKAIFIEQGVDGKDFDKTFRSFTVESKLRRARDASKRYGIKGVPALIINGKYRTNARLAGSNANMLKVVDYLVEQERKAK
jgi:thiol:disulfide interchange protein DsbA